MNQTFSISRFGRLLRKYFTDNRGQLLANLALLTGILFALVFLFYYGYDPQAIDHNRQIPFFFVGCAAWYVFTWQQTEVLNQKERAITYLLQPASQVEKFMLIWLVSGIGFLIVYLLLFTIVDAIGVFFVNHQSVISERQKAIGPYKLPLWFQSTEFLKMPLLILVLTVLLHPFTLAFSLLLRRFSLPLVAVLAVLLIVVGTILNLSTLESMTGLNEINNAFPFGQFIAHSPQNESSYRVVDLPQPIGSQIRYAVGIVAVVLLYITAYFRLKEREV